MSLFDSIGNFLAAPLTAGASLLSSGLSAAVGLAGGLLTNQANANNTANAFNNNLAVADTSYQRATADMEAAGLNPILAYSMGGEPIAQMGVPVVQNVLGQASNSGFDAYSTMMNAGLTQQQTALTAFNAGRASLEGNVTGDFNSLYNTIKGRVKNAISSSSAKNLSQDSSAEDPLDSATYDYGGGDD